MSNRSTNHSHKATLFEVGLCGPLGDAVDARLFSDRLLMLVSDDHDFRDARLLLTVIFLHLECPLGPEPTLADVIDLLGGGHDQVMAKLRGDPFSITEYAICELGSLTSEQQSLAVETALAAVKLAIV